MLDQFTPCQLDRLSESQSRNEHDKKQQNRDEKIEVNTDGKLERGSIEPTVYNGSLPRIESMADQRGGGGGHGYTSASLTKPPRGSDRSPLGSWGSVLESSGDASVRAKRETNGRAAAQVGNLFIRGRLVGLVCRRLGRLRPAGAHAASLGSRLPPCHSTA
jgi:hypothetical protein